ncbi:MAG: hypothetical protein ACLSAH_02270 [Bilophila wadsworthia]
MEALLDRHWLLREPGSGTRETFLRQLTPRGLRPQILLNSSTTTPSSRFSTIRVCSPASPRASCSGKSAPVNCSSSA